MPAALLPLLPVAGLAMLGIGLGLVISGLLM